MQTPGVITGAGGPSGTGKRPTVESILPPPVFVQDPALARKVNLASQSSSPKLEASASSENIAGQEDVSTSSTTSVVSNEAESKGNNGVVEESQIEMGENESNSAIADAKSKSDVSSSQEKKSLQEKEISGSAQSRSEEKPIMSDNPNQVKKEASSQSSPSPFNLVSSSSFNGLGNCAVFPVPVSSLTVSIWSNLLKSTSDDLKINPYALIALPVTELFELTIPPVDAACMSVWPKPISYYCQGVSGNGVTHAPAGQHVYYRSTGFQENTPTDSPQTSTQTQAPQLQQPQPQIPQPQPSAQRPSGSSPARFYPPSQPQGNSYSHVAYSGNNSSQAQPSMATLQQMFPSVNMAYGSKPSPSYHNLNDPSQRGTYTNESLR